MTDDSFETRFPRPVEGLTPDQMWTFFTGGVIGTKEFRGWLAKYDPTFAELRDADVDNEIDRLARERAEANRSAIDPPTDPGEEQ